MPAKYASVIHSDWRAALAMTWSSLRMPGGARLVADDPETRVPRGIHLGARPPLALGNRRAHRGPDPGERLLHVGHRGALDLHPGVAPGRDPLHRVSGPRIAHAQTGDEPNPPVHAHRLAVVAVHPSQRARPVERVEAADLDPRLAERAPHAGRRPETAGPVVDETDLDSLAGPRTERVHELLPGAIGAKDVGLEVDVATRGADGLEPGGEVLRPIAEQPDAVA